MSNRFFKPKKTEVPLPLEWFCSLTPDGFKTEVRLDLPDKTITMSNTMPWDVFIQGLTLGWQRYHQDNPEFTQAIDAFIREQMQKEMEEIQKENEARVHDYRAATECHRFKHTPKDKHKKHTTCSLCNIDLVKARINNKTTFVDPEELTKLNQWNAMATEGK